MVTRSSWYTGGGENDVLSRLGSRLHRTVCCGLRPAGNVDPDGGELLLGIGLQKSEHSRGPVVHSAKSPPTTTDLTTLRYSNYLSSAACPKLIIFGLSPQKSADQRTGTREGGSSFG